MEEKNYARAPSSKVSQQHPYDARVGDDGFHEKHRE
jgi:hypothetical protein